MNTRAVCDNHSKLSVKFPQFARHEKLAFIERVCALLIESRFDNGHAEAWEHWCSSSENDLDKSIREKPRFARPAAPAKRCSLPATYFPDKGTPGFLVPSISDLSPFVSTFSSARSARGSPS
jgi:hypothetical protein